MSIGNFFTTVLGNNPTNIIYEDFVLPFNRAANGPQAQSPDFLLNKFKIATSNSTLINAVKKSKTPESAIDIFAIAAKHLPAKDITAMVQHMNGNVVFDVVAPKRSGYVLSDVLNIMVDRSPNNQRLALLDVFEGLSGGQFLPTALTQSANDQAAIFFSQILEGTETKQAIERLQQSVAWKSIPRNEGFVGWIDNVDKRLMPAL